MRAGELKHLVIFCEQVTTKGKYLESKEELVEKYWMKCKLIQYKAADEVKNMENFNEQFLIFEAYRRPITTSMIAKYEGNEYDVVSIDPSPYDLTMKISLKRIKSNG